MNGAVRQGMPAGIVQAQNNMLAIGNPPFMQNSPHMGQPPLGQAMGVPQNMNPSNPPMGMLSGGPVPSSVNQRFPMPPNGLPQHQPPQQRPMLLRQGQNPPQLNSAGGAPSAAHLQAHIQGMQFPGNMMQQPPGPNNPVRRVQSQPTMNPLGGMPNAVGGAMNMSMNQQTGMPGQLRQAQAQAAHQQQLRLQQQHQAMVQADIMRSQAPNQSMPPNMARTASNQGQVMSSLSQPSPLGSMQHPGGLQQALHQNPFPNGGPIPSQHPPPQMSSSPRPTQNHTPSMSMGTPGPSHTPVNRARMTPDNSSMSFMGFPGSQFPGNNGARVSSNPNPSAYPSFVQPSSTPAPMQMDLPQSSPSGMMHSQVGTPNRSTFMPTPAQQYVMTGSQPMDIYPPSFGMPPPANVPPPRPPSHATNPHQPQQQQSNPQQQQSSLQQPQQPQQQTHHQSPSQSDQMNVHPQRPQSQPQQMMPGRPPSQTGTTRTPRPMQLPLPSAGLPGPLTATGRLPVAQQTQGPPGPAMMPIAPRPPLAMGGVPAPPSSSAQMAVDAPPSVAAPIQRPPGVTTTGLLQPGQGIIRLLQFSGVLSSETKIKLQLSWWNDLVKEYFTPRAIMKLTLWKDNQRIEAKPFEIGVPILPRFFLVTTQSGVKSMSFSLDGARERAYATGGGHTVVECVSAIWTYRYANGYTVILRGPLTAHVVVTATVPPGNSQAPQYTLKFDELQFDANLHDKYIALDSIIGSRSIESPKTPRTRNAPTPTPGTSSQAQLQQQQIEEDKKWEEPRVLIDHGSIPGEPVNAFGIPQATMRCLELAESVSAMADLISFSNETSLGPLDALKKYATKIKESQAISGSQHQQSMNTMPLNSSSNTSLSNSFSPYQPPMAHSTPVTLYSSAPPSVTNPPPPNSSSSMNSPQNTSSSSTNSPEKQPKTIPQPQQVQTPSQSGPASSPAVSSGGTTNTPAMSNTSLKRKQGDASSPTVGNSEQQPAKRVVRKRGRTGAGAG